MAVIGAGRMGRLYARLVHETPELELAAIVTHRRETVTGLEAEFGVPACSGGDLSGLWKQAAPPTAVIISTPEWAHCAPAIAALDRGVHVLLEKPMADSLEAARRIADAARRAPGVFMMCHIVRFDARYELMREAVAGGRVGRVRHMHARRNADTHAAARILGRCHPAYWLMPHDVDVMRWITGEEVVSVSARAVGDGQQPADALFVDLRFTSGVTGRIENAWLTPPLPPQPRDCFFEVSGDAGRIELDASAPVLHDGVDGAAAAMVRHFAACVSGFARAVTTADDGFRTIVVADAIERSLRERRDVEIEVA